MTRPHTTLPLDEAALDRLDGRRYPDKWTGDDESMLLAQSRAALALEAERDALKAQVERLCEAINSASHELRLYGDPGPFAKRILDAALAASPAQSLAAHDAEVRAQALREASDACLAQAREWEKERCSQASSYVNAFRIASRAILALAERAPEVER